MTSPLPTLQYLVAFNNGAYDDPGLIASVAAPGVLGAVNVWTDITQFVKSDDGQRGRQHELNQFEAGTRQLALWNDDGRFSPSNSSGPYFGLLLPGRPLQVRVIWNAVTYYRFTGQVDAWKVLWPDPRSQEATVHATDAFRLFGNADIISQLYPKQVLADGATDYWRLNDPQGSTVAANFAAGNRAYPQGVAFGQTGAMVVDPATSAQLCDSSNNYLGFLTVTPPWASVSHTTVATFEAWVSAKSWNPGGIGSTNNIVCYSSSTNASIDFYVDNSGKFAISHSDNASGFGVLASTTATIPANGTWHHVVGVLNGASTALYLDGVAVTATLTGNFTAQAAWSPVVGAIGSSTGAGQTAQFPGLLQDVAVYNGVALNATQVAAHFSDGAFTVEGTGARIGHVLNVIGWSAGARDIDTGSSNVQAATSSLVTTTCLAHMQDCESTEAGALYMGAAGKVRFLSRNTLLSQYLTSQATFGDNVGEISFVPGQDRGVDDLDIYNQASAQRSGGSRQTWPAVGSATPQYGNRTWQPNGTLLGTNDPEVLSRLQYVVNQYQSPVERLSSITVDVLDAVGDGTVAALLALEVLYRVTVNRHATPDGSTFTQVGLIEHLQEHIDANSWTVTFSLDPADTQTYWLWGSGAWGQTSRWAF